MGFPNLNGQTRVCGLLGYPVEHSFSPAMHNAAFQALGLNWAYVPFGVHPERLSQALQGMVAMGLAGVNVTVPHKQNVLPLLDHVDHTARLMGAVNTIVNREGQLFGYNTDGPGFVIALEQEAGFHCNGKRVLLLGAGGAARAVAVQLALQGAQTLTITNRSREKAEGLAREIQQATGTEVEIWPWGQLPERQVADLDLIVQTTPLGMSPGVHQAPDFPYQALHSGQLVCDLIYNPPETLFLRKAAEQGAKIMNGRGMLLYQGVLAFEIWTGLEAPVDIMRQALGRQLACSQE